MENDPNREVLLSNTDEDDRPEFLLTHASILSRISFAWAYPTLKLGSKKPLEDRDLPKLHTLETSAFNRDKIEEMWNNEKCTGRMNLGRALIAEYFISTLGAQFLMFINMIARICQAWALGMLMEQFGKFDVGKDADSDAKTIDVKMGYLYAGIMVLCGLIAFPSKQAQFFQTYRVGLQMRLGLVAAIYSKTLRLPALGVSGNDNLTAGHVTNLASNDVERFLSTSVTATFLLIGPLVTIIILVVGIYIIGPVFAAGYGLLMFLVPLQIYYGRRFAYFRSKVAAHTDDRVNLISQAVNGARVMKFNGWEHSFLERIEKIRQDEVALLQRASVFKALNEALFFFTSLVVSVFIFTLQVLLGNQLTPKGVFTTMTLFNIVQFILAKHVPNAVMGLSECFISCKRIQAFFENSEHETLVANVSDESIVKQEPHASPILCLSKVTCHWDTSAEKVALSDISVAFEEGKLYCIVGQVGCGKSALLQAIAGELPVSEGIVRRNYTSLSYAVQDPWIMDASVRENIIMGCKFDKDWYENVVNACGLDTDISDFLLGDGTILGDRGVQCSGGQRARIGLARAIYCDSQILLLDDPLSAVDSKVAHSIFYSAIKELSLNRGCCVILVTHQHQFADDVDSCLYMNAGTILAEGSFSECVSNSDGKMTNPLKTEKDYNRNEQPVLQNGKIALVQTTRDSEAIIIEDEAQVEKRTTGIIRFRTWKAYGHALGGAFICVVFFVSFAATQVSQLVAIIHVGNWSASTGNQRRYIALSLWLSGGVIVLSISRAYFTFYCLIRASRRLHHRMLKSVLRSKIQFYDTNPLGRILNRFSADVGICDETLPLTIYDFAVGVFLVIGSICTSIATLPFILILLPPLLYYFIHLRRVFVNTTRELKRLEGMARSPIFAMMSEALKGIVTIRSNDKLKYFSKIFEDVQNTHTRAFFSFTASSRWFAFNLDFLSFILTAVASIFAVLFQHQGWFQVDPAILGVSLTLLIQISTSNFPWVIRQSAEVTNQMVSVERIVEFGAIESEAPLNTDLDQNLQAKDWPKTDTSITVNDLTVRYRKNLLPALDGISFQIMAGQRVGIVGRTGSGKSTLVQAFLRILEAESGLIEIGGTDISLIGLHKLRTSIAVIPQLPVLFSGSTIRENLDPFLKYSESKLYDALEAVQLKTVIDALPAKLDSLVADGGSNFSVGQRQLLCLARALLLNNQIIILDEPTANVDSNTDYLLQNTLRDRFSGATIISVAHRLDTIIAYDRIAVLGHGKLLEFGTPSELLSRDEGHFSLMVESTGEAMARYLRNKVNGTTQSC